MSKAYVIDDNKGLEMSWDYNNRLYKVEDDEMTMTFNRTGSGQKLGKSVYVGPKPKYPFRPLFRSPIRDIGGTFIPVDTVVEAGTTVSTDYFGAYEYVNGKFSRFNTATGYRDSVGTHVYVRDWQGNIRAVVRKGDDGSTVLEQATYYYPYGMPMAESTNPTANRYKYTGKELLTNKGFNCYDYGARFYDPATCLWLSPDPHSSDYAPMSHYSMCAGDPINHFDPDGMDWYETLKYSIEYDVVTETWNINLVGSGELAYTECTSQSEMDNAGIQGRYIAPIVVVMNGSMNEKLGFKGGQYGYIDGEGAITASVTVYGPKGANDIGHYTGFSMTSDYKKFGAIADGEYDVKYDVKGKTGKIQSHYAINGRGPVDCINGVNPSPKEYKPKSSTQKDGIFIHSTNPNGFAGDLPHINKAISSGCPLISYKDWPAFQKQIGVNGFTFILTRTK